MTTNSFQSNTIGKPLGMQEYSSEGADKKRISFELREIIVWNVTSNRKTCALAWTGDLDIDCAECSKGILSRWGASENTFKHIS